MIMLNKIIKTTNSLFQNGSKKRINTFFKRQKNIPKVGFKYPMKIFNKIQ